MTIARLLPRFRDAYRSIEALAARETWPRAEIEQYQLARLNETWAHAIEHVPYYRDVARQCRLPARFAGLDEFVTCVPVLERSLVRDQPGRFLSNKAARGCWSVTSGSTGIRTRVFWERRAHLESLRGRYRFLDAWGIDIFDRSAMLWGDRLSLLPLPRRVGARVVRFAQDRLRGRLRLEATRLDPATLRGCLRRMARFQPVVLYAYSAAAYMLAREAIESGLRCESLRLAILTSELAAPHMIETVERAFGAPAVLEYGSVECGFLAGEYPDRHLRVREESALLETLPRPDGRYDLAVTVLGNSSFPLFRYLIGDTTDAPLLVPASGLAVLRGLSGRQNDVLVTRAGVVMHAAPIIYMLESDPGVRRFRARQTPDGSVQILVERCSSNRAVDVAGITRRLEDLIGFPVLLDQVAELPHAAGSKHRPVVSDRVLGAHGAPARERRGAEGSPRSTEPGSGAEPRSSSMAS